MGYYSVYIYTYLHFSNLWVSHFYSYVCILFTYVFTPMCCMCCVCSVMDSELSMAGVVCIDFPLIKAALSHTLVLTFVLIPQTVYVHAMCCVLPHGPFVLYAGVALATSFALAASVWLYLYTGPNCHQCLPQHCAAQCPGQGHTGKQEWQVTTNLVKYTHSLACVVCKHCSWFHVVLLYAT